MDIRRFFAKSGTDSKKSGSGDSNAPAKVAAASPVKEATKTRPAASKSGQDTTPATSGSLSPSPRLARPAKQRIVLEVDSDESSEHEMLLSKQQEKKRKDPEASNSITSAAKKVKPAVARQSPRRGTTNASYSDGEEDFSMLVQDLKQTKPVKPAPRKVKASPNHISILLPDQRLQAEFDVNAAAPQCLQDVTFVFTGVADGDVLLSREDATEMVKTLGGRVTTAVSQKTDYLVTLGLVLEDGRPYTEGSKYKKVEALKSAKKSVYTVEGVQAFFGLLARYSERHGTAVPERSTQLAATAAPASLPSINDSASSQSLSLSTNPYARASNASANPYARSSNASAASANPYGKRPSNVAAVAAATTALAPSTKKASPPLPRSAQLWVDKYKPTSSADILGNQDCVKKLAAWLQSWEIKFNRPEAMNKAFSSPSGPWKAALLSGPPGIGSK
jgi:replication factor C subunit 1